jgi:hypothetical protein
METGLPVTHAIPGLHNIRIEEHLTDGVYVLKAELPGIDPAKDVEITVTEGVLTLRSERGEETTEKHRTEFRYGGFARSVRLPAGAKGDEATAEYRNGCPDDQDPGAGAGAGAGDQDRYPDRPGAARLIERTCRGAPDVSGRACSCPAARATERLSPPVPCRARRTTTAYGRFGS